MTNDTPLTAAQSDLAAAYLPLALAIAAGYRAQWPNHAPEFRSAASYGLVRAARGYDAARGVKFATYARRRVVGEIRTLVLSLLRDYCPGDPSAALAEQAASESPGGAYLAGYDRRVGHEADAADEVEHLLRCLPPRHAEVVRLLYLDGRSQAEASAATGLAKSRISTLHSEAIARLRDAAGGRFLAGLEAPCPR